MLAASAIAIYQSGISYRLESFLNTLTIRHGAKLEPGGSVRRMGYIHDQHEYSRRLGETYTNESKAKSRCSHVTDPHACKT
jgi:hypothetical protein